MNYRKKSIFARVLWITAATFIAIALILISLNWFHGVVDIKNFIAIMLLFAAYFLLFFWALLPKSSEKRREK